MTEPLLIGIETNDAGTAITSLSSKGSGDTLRISNNSTSTPGRAIRGLSAQKDGVYGGALQGVPRHALASLE